MLYTRRELAKFALTSLSIGRFLPTSISASQVKLNSLAMTVTTAGIVAARKQVKVWGRCGGQITFNIINETREEQHVRIPPADIVPSPATDTDATPFPLKSGRYAIRVLPGQKASLVVKVKPKDDFPWNLKKEGTNRIAGMTYKCTVYSNEHFLDRDLVITR